jgi:hypothetical protein
MRNRLIHGYFDVNLDVVWETISHDLPQLLAEIETVLSKKEQTRPQGRYIPRVQSAQDPGLTGLGPGLQKSSSYLRRTHFLD